MARGDIKTIIAEFERDNIENILINLGKALNNYLTYKLPEDARINDFFKAFYEGHNSLYVGNNKNLSDY